MSDNGSVPNIPGAKKYDKSYNYPLSRGKWDAFEGGIRVPFIFMGPGINERRYTDTPISFSDIFPTITELAGNKIFKSKNLDGGSFKKLLFNKSDKVFRKTKGLIFHVPYENKIALERAHSAIIVDNYKLIKFYDNNEINLYDVVNDISESTDLSKIHINEKLSNRLEKLLDKYLEKVEAPKWQPGITWKENPLKIINSFH